VSRIWVRNHWEGGWITVFWRHLRSMPAPFGELAWDHARQALTAAGTTPTEEQIAAAVGDLLARAAAGPTSDNTPGTGSGTASKRDRRIAARTKATAAPAWPRPDAPPPPTQPVEMDDDLDDGAELAEVLPLRIFDARKEAERWPY
jgi:putative transposase